MESHLLPSRKLNLFRYIFPALAGTFGLTVSCVARLVRILRTISPVMPMINTPIIRLVASCAVWMEQVPAPNVHPLFHSIHPGTVYASPKCW